jgi:hypothetical protein
MTNEPRISRPPARAAKRALGPHRPRALPAKFARAGARSGATPLNSYKRPTLTAVSAPSSCNRSSLALAPGLLPKRSAQLGVRNHAAYYRALAQRTPWARLRIVGMMLLRFDDDKSPATVVL